jgi:hypothetical protein
VIHGQISWLRGIVVLEAQTMKLAIADWKFAIKDNFGIWKTVVPILLGGSVAGLTMEFAVGDPIVFLAWSMTCFVSGVWVHHWWCKRILDTPDEWS